MTFLSGQPDQPDTQFQQVNNALLNCLQEKLNDGTIPTGGFITSFISVVEVTDNEGKSRVMLFFNDDRTTVMLGLLAYANIEVTRHS